MLKTCARTGVLLLALFSTVCAVGITSVENIVHSQSLALDPQLASYAVNVHVVLQIHEHPDSGSRAKQDPAAVAACQANVVRIVDRNAAAGIRVVVAEGFYAAGSLDHPQPITVRDINQQQGRKAKWLLAQRADLTVYGFELEPLNDFGVRVVEELGRSIDALDDLAAPAEINGPAHRALVREEVTRLNLWHSGIVPQRSFLGLQTALAVALARGEKAVQLLIGREHWPDLVYAANRHRDVRIRLLRSDCELH